MTLPVPLTTSETDGCVVARLSGALDIASAPELEHELFSAVTNATMALIVDLTEVQFLDSSAIRILFDLAVRLERRQQQLRLVVPRSSPIMRMLSIVQLPSVVPVLETPEEAIARSGV